MTGHQGKGGEVRGKEEGWEKEREGKKRGMGKGKEGSRKGGRHHICGLI